MKKLWTKIKPVLKKVCSLIKKYWYVLVGAIALFWLYDKVKTLIVGEVKHVKKFEQYQGNKHKITIWNDDLKIEGVDLPYDKNGKQYEFDDIEAAGLPENYKEGGYLNVKIKHDHIDRRNID